MVSLEDRSNYLSNIQDKPKLKALYDLVYGNKIVYPPKIELNQTDIIYYDLVIAIQQVNEDQFTKAYSQISRRKPTKDSLSPFVHDDFLIFALILGISQFQVNKEWIQYIIKLRNRNQISITLDNILNSNYKSTSNIPEIVITYLSVFNISLVDSELLDRAYKTITNNTGLFESQFDISILSALKAFDLIIETRTAPYSDEVGFLKGFEKKFLARVGIISVALYNLILLLSLYGLAQIVHTLPKELKDQLNEINLIIGIIGVGLIGGNLLKTVRKRFQKWIYRLLGYNSSNIEKMRE